MRFRGVSSPLIAWAVPGCEAGGGVTLREQSQQMLIHHTESQWSQQCQQQVLSGSLVGGGDASLQGKR